MTIAPEQPRLEKCEEDTTGNVKTLVEEHITFVSMVFGYSLMVRIKPGLVTDGASVPDNILEDDEYGRKVAAFIRKKYPTVRSRGAFDDLVKSLIGTPWDMPRLLAAIVHDVLYGMKWKFRWLCDRVYRNILSSNNYDPIREEIEYCGIRLVGWRNWNAVTKDEIKHTKELVSVAWVKTKSVGQIIEQLKEGVS